MVGAADGTGARAADGRLCSCAANERGVVFQDTVKASRWPTATLKAFPSVFGMDTGRCLKRRTDRACSPMIRAIHSRWTERFEDFFKCSTQLALRLDLIRGLTPLIRKLHRIGVSPGANPDLHCGYHACLISWPQQLSCCLLSQANFKRRC